MTSLALQIASTLSAQGVVAATHVDPIPGTGTLTEVRIVQPVVMLHSTLGTHFTLRATLDLEGLTIPDGVLTVGAWGEGFNDRRHPHTYAHEIMVSAAARNVSLSAGKGFVPFGSDDPMSRPPRAYPANHHWSQILERAVVIAGVRAGPLLLEGSLFNGDEPERPAQWPLLSRFGDSWAGRVTVIPRPWLELEGSHASVKSPEHRPGFATTQEKSHISARSERDLKVGRVYALVEWARTTEAGGFFAFNSVLAEAAWALRGFQGYYRLERTDRPEEERTLDPFRSQRPHIENSILGTTRWTIHTAGSRMGLGFAPAPVRVEVIVEGSYAAVADVGQGVIQSIGLYGKDRVWSLTVGLRVSAGSEHRMGRYGVAATETAGHAGH